MRYIITLFFLLVLVTSAQAQVYQNRFTTNQEPIANGVINGAPLTNVPITSVSNLSSSLTALTNLANTKIDTNNGTGFATTLYNPIIKSANGTNAITVANDRLNFLDPASGRTNLSLYQGGLVIGQGGIIFATSNRFDGESSFIIGTNNTSLNDNNQITIGFGNVNQGLNSRILGWDNDYADGHNVLVFGDRNLADGDTTWSLALGYDNHFLSTAGDYPVLIGAWNENGGSQRAAVLGYFVTNTTPFSVEIGATDDSKFQIQTNKTITQREASVYYSSTPKFSLTNSANASTTNMWEVVYDDATDLQFVTRRPSGIGNVRGAISQSGVWTIPTAQVTSLNVSGNITNGVWLWITNTSGTLIVSNLITAERFSFLSNGNFTLGDGDIAAGGLTLSGAALINGNITGLGNLSAVSNISGASLNISSNAFVGGSLTATNLAGDRLLVSDSSKRVTNSAVTTTEANYLSGVTSAIQTQINRRVADSGGSATNLATYGDFTVDSIAGFPNLTPNRVVIIDGDNILNSSGVSGTELTNLVGTTGGIQTNIDARIRTVDGIFTNSLTGKGHLSIQSNALINSLTVTNAQTNLAALKVAGQLTTTNPAIVLPLWTNSVLYGVTTNAEQYAILQTNVTGLAAGNNNLNIGNRSAAYLAGTPGASFNLNSLQGPRDGRVVHLLNGTGYDMTIVYESGFAASAADRIITPGLANVIAPNGSVVSAFYSTNVSRWYVQLGTGTNSISGFVQMNGGFATNLIVYTNLTLTNAITPVLDHKTSAASAAQHRFSYNGVNSWIFDYGSNQFSIVNFDDTTVFSVAQDGSISAGTLTWDTTTLSTGGGGIDAGQAFFTSLDVGSALFTVNGSGDVAAASVASSFTGTYTGNGTGLTNFSQPYFTRTNSPGFNVWRTNTAGLDNLTGSRQHVTFSAAIITGVAAGAGLVAVVEDDANNFTNRYPWGLGALTGLAQSQTNTISFVVNPNARWQITTNGTGATITLQTEGFNISNE